MDNNFFKKIKFEPKDPFKGAVLISEPFSIDSFFKRTVVLLVDHNEEGTVGFVLNKPFSNITVNEAIEGFPKYKDHLYSGGPVEKENLYFLHNVPDKIPDGTEIIPGLFWGGDFATLQLMLDTKQIKESQVKLFAGYSGWGKGQLNEEITEKSWIVTEDTVENILSTYDKNYWNQILGRMGTKFSIMSNFPEDPLLN